MFFFYVTERYLHDFLFDYFILMVTKSKETLGDLKKVKRRVTCCSFDILHTLK